VVRHVHLTKSPEDRGAAVVDIFRVDHGRIVEHWDRESRRSSYSRRQAHDKAGVTIDTIGEGIPRKKKRGASFSCIVTGSGTVRNSSRCSDRTSICYKRSRQ